MTHAQHWQNHGDHLERVFPTGSFKNGLALLNAIGFLAERMNHHPDVELTYPKLTVRLKTHDANAITHKDHALAAAINALLDERV